MTQLLKENHNLPDNETGIYLRLTINQVLIFIGSFIILLAPIVFGAGNYATQFEYLKKEVLENKISTQEINKSVQELTIEIKSLRTGINNADTRRSSTSQR